MTNPIHDVRLRVAKIYTPREPLNVWQWADKFRFLAKGTSQRSRHGNAMYRSCDAPHQREPQESMTDPAVQVTCLIMASQIGGKTEMLNNLIGYHMDYRPANSVVMYPTIDSAEKYSKKKLMPAINATPCLDAVIAPSKSRTSGNTILVKDYVGGSVFMVGANSPASLRQASGEVLVADEIDSFESDVGGEGDPVDLLWKRGESFPACIKVVSSTPTIAGQSRIWNWFDASDKRYWFMPCVHCGAEISFRWAMVKWPKDKPDECVIECDKCSKSISDSQRLDMYHAGRWKPTAEFKGVRGYHLNWIYCPWAAQKGFKNRLHQMAVEWSRAAHAGKQNEKVLINTGLCECFEEEMEHGPDASALLLRCQPYASYIPVEVVYLTCSVDVQKDRLELEIVGWGEGEECWGIETKKIFGNPHLADVWTALDTEISRVFDHPLGAKLKISCALIDSGGQSDNRAFAMPVYRFVKRRQGRFVFASKGSSEAGSPAVVGRLQKNGIFLQMIGTDVCKSTVYDRLEIQSPGPRFCHFPQGRGYDAEYFAQLTAESVMQSKTLGSSRRVWVKRRARNEALDLRAGNVAAFELRNPNLKAIAKSLGLGEARMTNVQPDAKSDVPISEVSKKVVISHSEGELPAQRASQPRPGRIRRRSGFVRW